MHEPPQGSALTPRGALPLSIASVFAVVYGAHVGSTVAIASIFACVLLISWVVTTDTRTRNFLKLIV